MEQVKRIEWVDIVKYICIIMVMLSHLETRTEIWKVFYSPFSCLLFSFQRDMCISSEETLKNFYIKKSDNYLYRGCYLASLTLHFHIRFRSIRMKAFWKN